MKHTTTTTTTTTNAFAELLRNYEQQARQRTPEHEGEYAQALTDLATACAYSVLKKLCNVGSTLTQQSKTQVDTTRPIRELRRSLAMDMHTLERIRYASDNATALEYNADGDLVTVIKDKSLYDALATLCSQTLGDGIDLAHTAMVTILDQTGRLADLSSNFLETPYTVRRLKRKVYIKDVDSVDGWEETTTTPIQEVFRAIRRDIAASRSIQTASHKYTYLDDVITDEETGDTTDIYHRLPKYSGLATEVVDYSGKVTAITADKSTVDDMDRLVAKLNLTAKQAKILQLRQCGYGYKAIATYLGVTQRAVAKTVGAIQQKAISIGITPPTAHR